jgi:succinoglycan biosynthesis protein ExoO
MTQSSSGPGSVSGLSICIPNWNHKHFLPRAVRSALRGVECLRRAGIPAEVIVVDDASRDGSQRALFAMALAEPEGILDVVLAEKNAGLSATRMQGLRLARYRWACLLDADNEIVPENLPTFVRAADETAAAMIYGNLLKMATGEAAGLISNDVVHEEIFEENYIDAFAIVDRRKALAHGGYREDMTSHEDWELTLHLIAEGESIVFVPAVLGHYHVENHSMVKTTPFEHRRMHRIFNQRGTGFSPAFTARRMYHPALGWL